MQEGSFIDPKKDEFISVGDMIIVFSNYLLNSLNIKKPHVHY
jgi:hypothetical protein